MTYRLEIYSVGLPEPGSPIQGDELASIAVDDFSVIVYHRPSKQLFLYPKGSEHPLSVMEVKEEDAEELIRTHEKARRGM